LADNPWRRGSLDDNPYDWTAFQLTGLSPAETSSRRIAERLRAVTRAIERRPGSRTAGGRAVTVADINAAKRSFSQACLRALDELLEHRPEAPCTDPVERVSPLGAATDVPQEARPAPRMGFLLAWVESVLVAQIAHMPVVPVDPGEAEARPLPPVPWVG